MSVLDNDEARKVYNRSHKYRVVSVVSSSTVEGYRAAVEL